MTPQPRACGHNGEDVLTLSSMPLSSEMSPNGFVAWLPVNKAMTEATCHCCYSEDCVVPPNAYQGEQGIRGQYGGGKMCNMEQRYPRGGGHWVSGEKAQLAGARQ